jgi:pimeloyl-ACP methyl ester carboxylesterase
MSAEGLPPASLLLVHGAGSGPWVYEGWAEEFASVPVLAVDLHEGLDVEHASMADYADRVVCAAARLATPVALCGWSLGGLVVLQAAERVAAHSVILLEASASAEIQGFNANVELTHGTFDPEVVYGSFPPGVRARPESLLACAERKRGISVPSLPCASLVIYGDDFREERGLAIARLYGSQKRYIPGLDHWGVVQDRRVREAIAEFLGIPRP